MNRRMLVGICVALMNAVPAFSQENNEFGQEPGIQSIPDFVAPVVWGTSNIPTQLGAIVYDASSPSSFKGVDNTGSWITLGAAGTAVPTGTVMAYVGTSAPSGWLLCDGTSYLRTVYPSLATLLGCSGSSCAYGAADSTHFNVPDLRGRFLRGLDGTAGIDPDKSSRTAMATGGNVGNNLGSVQDDRFQGHKHQFVGSASNAVNGTGGSIPRGDSNTTAWNVAAFNDTPITDGSNGTPRTSSETRPVNAYVNFIIKI